MNSVKTKQMKYTAEAKLIMPVNKCKTIEKFVAELKDDSPYQCKALLEKRNNPEISCIKKYYQDKCAKTCSQLK